MVVCDFSCIPLVVFFPGLACASVAPPAFRQNAPWRQSRIGPGFNLDSSTSETSCHLSFISHNLTFNLSPPSSPAGIHPALPGLRMAGEDDRMLKNELELDEMLGDSPLLGRIVTPPPRPKPKSNLVYLDGLRGLAALLVYFSHHVSWFYDPKGDIQYGFGYKGRPKYFATLPIARLMFTGGGAAVAIFFVLSGFVLSRSPLRMINDGKNPRNSLLSSTIRRPVRLFAPPIAISFMFAIYLQLPIPALNTYPGSEKTVFLEIKKWLKELIPALNPFTEHSPQTAWFPYDPPVWTMPVEFRGSIIVFALLAVSSTLTQRARLLIFTISGLLLLIGGSWSMACFMAGVVLAMMDLTSAGLPLSTSSPGRGKLLLFNIVFVIGCYLLSMVTGVGEPERSSELFGWYWITMATPKVYYTGEFFRFWHSIGAVLVVYAVLRLQWLQRNLSSLQYLGRISFSLYLSHIHLLWIVGDRVYRFFGFKRKESEFNSWFDNHIMLSNHGPYGLGSAWLFCHCLILPVSFLVAHVLTVYVDEPSTVLAKKFSTRVMSAIGRPER